MFPTDRLYINQEWESHGIGTGRDSDQRPSTPSPVTQRCSDVVGAGLSYSKNGCPNRVRRRPLPAGVKEFLCLIRECIAAFFLSQLLAELVEPAVTGGTAVINPIVVAGFEPRCSMHS